MSAAETHAEAGARVSRKRRVASLFLIAFALWPALHYGLVVQYGVDPWKLVGWAMYSAPGPMKSLQLAVEGADGRLRAIDPATYTEQEQRAHTRYFEHRAVLGGLADAGPLAAVFYERLAPDEGLVAALGSLSLDRETARVVLEMKTVRIDRTGRLVLALPVAVDKGPASAP